MQTYSDAPHAGISFQPAPEPHIQWGHVDGPLLVFRDGQLHWLTLWERIAVWLGWANAISIERKRRPALCDFIEWQC